MGVWVSKGCRGRFKLDVLMMDCGVPGTAKGVAHTCPVPRIESPLDASSQIEACVCFASGPSSGAAARRALYECGAPSGPLACVGDARGSEKAARCCARPPTTGCAPGFSTCAWHAEKRIAWVHPVKTGTSFLLPLARLANASLPDTATIDHADVRRGGTAWDRFFRKHDRARWFRGSDIWWTDGMSHSVVTDATYNEFRGRFFSMFRDPRERGWSSFNYFVGGASTRSAWPPARYATCIKGLVVGALTGQPTRADRQFGTVACHLPPMLIESNGTVQLQRSSWLREADPHGSCGCAPFRPNVALAKLRVAEGFAFAGIVEEWPLSMCLFALKFGVRCLPSLFANARPTVTAVLNRTPRSVYRSSPELFNVFADEHADMRLYTFVRQRFHAEAHRLGVTHARCASEVCPLARRYFDA